MLKVEDLEVKYGPIYALKRVSITVGKSEIVTVVGANGAGKSSLLKAIAGAVKSSSGKIFFEEKNVIATL